MKRSIRIGSRESTLALIQSRIVENFICSSGHGCDAQIVAMKTTGDRILDRTLDQVGGKGLFVKELDKALMDGTTDISVHSLKDIPMEIPDALPLIAYSAREDPRDVIVYPAESGKLDPSKPIGCSSRRRVMQLGRIFPYMTFESVRGNVQTRLRKLDEGQYGAVILAAAGLIRLGLEYRIGRYFTVEECIPAAGQGIIAVQGRRGEDYSFLDGFDSRDSRIEAAAERSFVKYLNGGCTSPVAAHGEIKGGVLVLHGFYIEEDADHGIPGQDHISLTGDTEADTEAAEKLGIRLAEYLQDGGRS